MIIRDFTDNDLYKFTTMNAVQNKFPAAWVRYSFINRGNTSFPEGFARELRKEVDLMETLQLSRESEEFIRKKCYFFQPVFIDLLKGFRFNPSEVSINQQGGDLEVTVEGLWYRTVLWEVPLLALISELYFKMTGHQPESFEQRTIEKAKAFSSLKANLSDFGTRRRYSFNVQNTVIEILKKYCSNYLMGTSNVYLAMKHDLTPIGTHPHEWFMYHGSHFGYRMANAVALENWVDVYQGHLGIALTDTFTSENFFSSFDVKYSKLFDGVRWDSGDPFRFTDQVIAHYTANRIDPKTKTIVYSDALNLDKIRKIREYVKGKIRDVYGIGTFLTNDAGVIPLNIVMKLTAVKPAGYNRFVPAIKLSDSEDKYSGDPEEISLCLKLIK